MKALLSKMYVFDWIGVGYNIFMGGILLFFHKGFENWYETTFIHIGLIGGILGIVWLYNAFPNRLTRFLRYVYPIILTGYYYGETQDYIFIIHDGWFDGLLISLETWLFGTEVTLWVEQVSPPWLTNLIILGYLSYYPLIALAPLLIYFAGTRSNFLTMICAYVTTFSISLPQFFLFPVEGPRWHLADQYLGPVQGGLFVDIAYGIMGCCAVHGGAMPSTHTAISIIYVFSLWRVNRKVFWVYLPFFIGLILGTFWGRFHYLTDTIVGILIAAFSLWLAVRVEKFDLQEPLSR